MKKIFTSSIRMNARGTFADGVDVTSVDKDTLAAALKVKLGLAQ